MGLNSGHGSLIFICRPRGGGGGGGGGGSEKISINRKKSEKTKNDPIIPAVVCSYTLKCYISITLIYYQCKVNKIWHF